ncbi:hypothetical protein K7887_22640 (plasmid) [Sutcliffiella horikoshii]|uniref:hypothetical protein n=1 Tax=Sutcliffiella horikoshii TaxID=79883 RepID=UPI001CBB6E48|nr:hypothetical protein [Sutcliffiella horikoshii]UAL49767.1 hypothetical protein K7887_22640 [Sutcliffiella horikoshii]
MTQVLVYLNNQIELQKVLDSFKAAQVNDGDIDIVVANSKEEFLTFCQKDPYHYYVIDNEEYLPLLSEKDGVALLCFGSGKQFNREERKIRFANVYELTKWLMNLRSLSVKSPVQRKKKATKKNTKNTKDLFNDSKVDNDSVESSKLKEKETVTEVSKGEEPEPILPDHSYNNDYLDENDMEVSTIAEQIDIEDQKERIAFRAKEIRKKIFHGVSWDDNKTIGVWSPLHRVGVTTFLINYAIFLGSQKIQCAVIEALNENHLLKTVLKRYNEPPELWTSYATALHNPDEDMDKVTWTYKNVFWLPLDSKDIHYNWDEDNLYHYYNNANYFDTLLVDLPTGKMAEFTLQTLNHLKELWVIVDDSYHQLEAWKNYIHNLAETHNIKVYLIFNKEFEFSQANRLAEELELPLLAALPPLQEEIMRNAYENKPIIEQKYVLEQLINPFTEITKHLIGSEFLYIKANESFLSRSLTRFQKALQTKKKHGII